MLQIQFLRRVQIALSVIESAKPLLQVVESLNNKNQEINRALAEIATGANIHLHGATINQSLAALPSITRSLSGRQLFREVDKLKLGLSGALEEDQNDSDYIIAFLNELESFADNYDSYIAHQNPPLALTLLMAARDLGQSLSNLRGFLEYIQNNTTFSSEPDQGEEQLSLFLLNVYDLKDFTEKLSALTSIYTELCMLLKISSSSHPLRIGKIESGSWFVKVFGDIRVITLIVDFLKGCVDFIYRNYTTEGKMASIPKKIEALDDILKFSERLKESGVDVTSMRDEIAKGGVTIANQLNILISGQQSVEINGQKLLIEPENQRKLSAQTLPRLASGTEKSEIEDEI